MVHPVSREDGPSAEFDYFRELWTRLLDPDAGFVARLEETFAAETGEFDLPYAFLSRIDRSEHTQHIEFAHGSHERLQPGEVAPLDRTYCRKTIETPDGRLAVSDAPAEGWADDPAYETFGLGSYLGTTVTVDGALYGTLCFASSDPRGEPITEREVALAALFARWVSYERTLSVRSDRPWIPGDAGLRADVLDPRLDTLIDLLRARERRATLLGLRDGTVRHRTDVTVPDIGAETLGMTLRHTHLPKLDAAGVVDWDRTTGRIEKGPNYGEIEPILTTLEDRTSGPRDDGTDDGTDDRTDGA